MANDMMTIAIDSFYMTLLLSTLFTGITNIDKLRDTDEPWIQSQVLGGITSKSTNTEAGWTQGKDYQNEKKNSLAFDVIQGIMATASVVFKILAFVAQIFINYISIGFWLLSLGAPAYIVALLVWSIQAWQLYYFAKFILKSERLVN